MTRTPNEKIGVVLLQLGGPDSLESVEPFLYNLFCDPDIIDLPLAFLFRKRLARWISTKRSPKVQELYRTIGGKSPILKLTRRQAQRLEKELNKTIAARVYVAMRYWHPFTEAAVEEMKNDGVSIAVLLPLYPHYSKSTTGSSVNELKRILSCNGINGFDMRVVDEYCEHPLYIKALVRNINVALKRVPEKERTKVHLVFSAHGTPMKLVRDGDPYKNHIERTYAATVKAGNWSLPHHLCFQSKVGPQQWLKPSLDETIRRLAEEKVSHVIVNPIAFVSDHIETLSEINMEAREQAHELGIRHFDMTPALNGNPFFIQALADLVLQKVKS